MRGLLTAQSDWLACVRALLLQDRGKDYNHSTFLDIIIAGLVGLRAAFGDLFAVEPLADDSIQCAATHSRSPSPSHPLIAPV